VSGRPSAVNQARAAVASASSTYTPGCSPGPHCYFPSRVNDGDRSTALGGNTSWANDNGQPLPQWVQLHWPGAITFSRVNLFLTTGYERVRRSSRLRGAATRHFDSLVGGGRRRQPLRPAFPDRVSPHGMTQTQPVLTTVLRLPPGSMGSSSLVASSPPGPPARTRSSAKMVSLERCTVLRFLGFMDSLSGGLRLRSR